MPSQSSLCSASLHPSTLLFLEQKYGIPYIDSFALFLLLRINDTRVTSELVELKFVNDKHAGYSRHDEALASAKKTASAIRRVMEKDWIAFRPEWVAAARGTCEGTMADNVVCGADTMPIGIDNGALEPSMRSAAAV